jgi:hypothetical protein
MKPESRAEKALRNLIAEAEILAGNSQLPLSARKNIAAAIVLLRSAHDMATLPYDPHREVQRKTQWEARHD